MEEIPLISTFPVGDLQPVKYLESKQDKLIINLRGRMYFESIGNPKMEELFGYDIMNLLYMFCTELLILRYLQVERRIFPYHSCSMVDVTNDNFDQLLPQILADVKSASYVAVDTEFTGLLVDDVFKGRLVLQLVTTFFISVFRKLCCFGYFFFLNPVA